MEFLYFYKPTLDSFPVTKAKKTCLYNGFNGGTLASALNLYDSQQTAQFNDPFLLNPSTHHTEAERERNRDPKTPFFDPEVNTWVGPFFMGPVNTRVVPFWLSPQPPSIIVGLFCC